MAGKTLFFLNQREIFYHSGLQLAVSLYGVGCEDRVLFFDGIFTPLKGLEQEVTIGWFFFAV